ncbi:hypothetical protein LX16_5012 [Stackebrandtia albiflava]|uniref:Uncharacterized protein n=1 Tax=Stackebrandtia albiflava TaxID=406432 RepID=A0A562UPI5_9ACTN|nr:hypothetical protein [Stackebrandtia albiflava]TWJ07528.1 hypothetical protein LX16_5012 [Stackebrandtia albiflava]
MPTDSPDATGEATAESTPPVVRMRLGARVTALAVTTVCALVMFATTAWGNDSWFPFAPMRMFATAADPNGVIEILRVEAVNENGQRMLLSQENSGIRWAEVDGQRDKMAEDPMLVKTLADAYHHHGPHKPKLIAVEILVSNYQLEDGSLTGECDTVLAASWYEDEVPPPTDGSLSPLSCERGFSSW